MSFKQDIVETKDSLSDLKDLPIPNPSQHFLSVIEGCKKLCAYCLSSKTRTKAGWFIYTKYKCNVCGIPLCQERSGRFCHYLYHKYVLSGCSTHLKADGIKKEKSDDEQTFSRPRHEPVRKRRSKSNKRKDWSSASQSFHIIDLSKNDPGLSNQNPSKTSYDLTNEHGDSPQDDEIIGPFLYDETGIEADITTKEM